MRIGFKTVAMLLTIMLAPVLAFAAVPTALAPALPPPTLPARGWLTLESPHFLVHFPPGQEDVARRLAWVGEQAHRSLLPKMQYLPEEKTHIVVADVSDVANAATRVTPYNYIMVYPVYPDNIGYDSGVVSGSADWFAQLLLHEYTHVLQLDMHAGNSSRVRRVLGKVPWAATPNSFLGYAILEGYATFEEGSLGSGRGDGSFYDMFLRAATLENQFPVWDRVIGNYDLLEWNPGPAVYLYGYSLLDYIACTYGAEKLSEIHRLHSEKPFLGTNGVISQVLDVPFHDVWDGWRTDLEDRYSKQREALEPTTELQVVPTQGHVALWPTWSPNGKQVVYGSTGGVVPSLRLRRVIDGQLERESDDRRLVNGLVERSNGYTWTPDGQSVVYGKLEYEKGSLTSDLYMYTVASGKQKRLTHGFRAYAPTVSPDGDWVAFLARREDSSRILVSSLYDISPMVLWSPPTQVSDTSQPVQVFSLAWSPQGDAIAFVGRDSLGRVDLFLLPVACHGLPVPAKQPLRLTQDTGIELDPAWSPDGRYLFYASDLSGVYNIHALDMEDGSTYQVTRVLYGVFSPCVSPDGTTLLATTYSSEGYDLATLPIRVEEWSLLQDAPNEPEEREGASAPDDGLSGVEDGVIRLPMSGSAFGDEMSPLQVQVKESTMNWERKPWERDMARAIDPRDFLIRRYAAMESLSPRYWFPVWGGPGDTWVTGGSTSGVDALGRHAYALAFSFGSEEAAYRAEYEYRPGPLGSGPALGMSLAGSREAQVYENTESGWEEMPKLAEPSLSPLPALTVNANGRIETAARASHTGEFYVIWDNPGLWRSSGAALWLRAHGGPGTIERETGASITLQAKGGHGKLERRGSLGLYAVQGLPLDSANGVAAMTLEASQGESGRFRLSLGGSGAVAKFPDSLSIGGEDGLLAVRGLPAGDRQGQYAGSVSVEGAFMAVAVQRGMGDTPVFLDNISWAVFSDSGFTANSDSPVQTVVTAGTELRLTGTLGYGLTRGDFRLGLARPVDGSAPWRIYWGFGAGF